MSSSLAAPPLRIAVLGGTGFVGRHLAMRLRDAGHQVTVLSRNRERHRELLVLPGVTVVDADVYDGATLQRRFADHDVVVNLVGILNEPGFGGRGFRRAHVELTGTALAAAQAAGVARFVQMSALNAGRGSSHYLRTRGEAEALVQRSPLHWAIVRPSVIFGPGDGLYFRFATLLRLAPVLPLARAGARFAPVYVGDVVEALTRCIERTETAGRVYELGGPDIYTLKQIVRYTAQQLGLRRAVIGLPDALGRLQALAMDVVPGKPFSSDNFASLALDSVPGEDGLAALGIAGTPVAAVVPFLLARQGRQTALDHYRRRREFM